MSTREQLGHNVAVYARTDPLRVVRRCDFFREETNIVVNTCHLVKFAMILI